ncbi:MAG: SusC/RagA family TonB-linked outer membrane protein [Longimicrobiales bacterium]
MPRRMLLLGLVVSSLLTPAVAFAQNTVLSGTVRSETQALVAGAFISIPALELTAVSNEYGVFRFEIPAARVTGQQVTIEVSSIGYSETQVLVTLRPGAITQDITLAERAIQLDEVVVTGTMGRTERRAQAAVVSTIDAARVVSTAPVTSVANLLQTRTPGVVLRNESGSTGTATTIRIRGVSSIDLSNEPLIFIDGIRVAGGQQQIYGLGGQAGSRLNDIKVEDIESMEVVKGPAAATLYGSDANAGVINIITKRGRAGSSFAQTINVEYGEADPNFTPLSNWGACTAFALARPTTYPACVGQPEGTILSDAPLQREHPFRDGRYRNVQYSLSGGGQNYGVYFSLGVDDDDGTLPNNEYGHLSTRANFDFFARENLRLELGFGLVRVNTQLPNNDNNIYGYLGGGFLGDPRTVGAAKDGWYAPNRQALAIGSIENSNKTTRFQPRGSINFTPWQWFSNRLTVGADMARTEAFAFWAKNDDGWWDNAPRNTGQIGETRFLEDHITFEYLGNITRGLTDDLRVDISFGSQAIMNREDETEAEGQGLVTNDVRDVNAAASLTGGGQESDQERDIGVFGQAMVSWRERLFVKAGLRRDQSSSFGAESKPFYSPSVGLSYVISEEPFFQDLIGFLPDGAITELRLRAAYGVTGRQPNTGARTTFNPSTNQISETAVTVGVRPDATGNPEIRAEKGQEVELGLDASLVNDRLGVELTYYRKKGIDQILELPVPASTGAEGPLVNIGSMLNEGFEIAANARLLTLPNLAWEMRGSVNTLRTELLDLGGVPESAEMKVGFPLNGEWDYTIREIDIANNRVIVSDTLEFQGNGSNYPGWDLALSSTLTLFQNVTLYAQIDGRGDRLAYDNTNQFRDRQFGQGEAAVRGAAAFGTDANGNPTEEAQREYMRRFGPFFKEDGTALNRNSVQGAYLQDAGFFKLREASINFRLPASFVQQYMRVRGASLGLAMRNLHTWTDFLGLDPESDQFLTVPSDRRWTVRFHVNF